jgi:hypothetical protein
MRSLVQQSQKGLAQTGPRHLGVECDRIRRGNQGETTAQNSHAQAPKGWAPIYDRSIENHTSRKTTNWSWLREKSLDGLDAAV